MALEKGDERRVAREITAVAPMLWDEGLGDVVRAALEAALEGGGEDALRELDERAERSRIFRAVVRRLAVELAEEARRAHAASLN